MKKAEIDESRWPIVIVRYHETLSDRDMDAHFDEIRALLARGQPYVMVSDFTEAMPAKDPFSRRKAGEFMKETAPLSEKLCAAGAYVVPNPLTRGALTAVFWFQKMGFPTSFFKTLDEALAWAEPFADRIRAEAPASPAPKPR